MDFKMNDAVSSALALAPLVLAQTPAIGATELGQWLLAGAAAAVIANQGIGFFKSVTGGFQKKQNPREENTQSVDLCDKKHLGIDLRFRDQEKTYAAKIEANRLEMKSDIKGIHSRIDDVMRGVARLEGRK